LTFLADKGLLAMNGQNPPFPIDGTFLKSMLDATSGQLQKLNMNLHPPLDPPALIGLPGPLHSGGLEVHRGPKRRVVRFSSPQAASGAIPSMQLPAALLSAMTGSNVYQATLGEQNQDTGEVSTSELLQILADGSAMLFDGRTLLDYAIGHIPGARSVAPKQGTPMSQYVSDVAAIASMVPNKNYPVVVYCNGPFCGKSRRLGTELVSAGFTNVRRYQLGTPVWRALVGPMEIEPEGIRYIMSGDQTAVFLDARSAAEFAARSLPGARNVPLGELIAAKDDGRLPMDDFNTRVVAFGRDGAQARSLAEGLAQNGFNNAKFYGNTFSTLMAALKK
jgi:rhodanese-related sulfurtransferase